MSARSRNPAAAAPATSEATNAPTAIAARRELLTEQLNAATLREENVLFVGSILWAIHALAGQVQNRNVPHQIGTLARVGEYLCSVWGNDADGDREQFAAELEALPSPQADGPEART